MTREAEDLLERALELPELERARLARQLLDSLNDGEDDEPAEVEKAWATEIERRADRADRGESRVIAWEEARAGLRRDISRGEA